ncbi:unnamed protein product [Penicillium salamii]|uniref:Gfd2/YDR514C-like C-terminal domain-containing protein n=1 Tax=Penicillium salamii TaxID=1612424 RepID=A0A9W4N902_9EURO|nr:unnamed protein product [Penicillium salamii]CAG8295557.1 unnamed protein product [Penicillium salamii]CAG8402457.1 unnamed protein product [Penicillium salamii]CAG8421801.1 unnamed protein product [Penicillium salamii]
MASKQPAKLVDARDRLKHIFQGDPHAMELDAGLNRRTQAENVRPKRFTAPAIHKPGVSDSCPEFDFDPVSPVEVPSNTLCNFSYIRSHVIGTQVADDSYLTELDQDPSSASCTPDQSPNVKESSDKSDSDDDLEDEDTLTMPSGTQDPEISNPTSFTSAVTMARYAVKYCSGKLAKTVSTRFYNGGKFWKRTWDLYHLPVPRAVSKRPFLLIPTEQAQALLDEINTATNFRLTLTGPGKKGLVLEFTDEELELFHPKFIGRSSCVEQKDSLVALLPPPLDSWGDWSIEDMPWALCTYELKIKQSIGTINVEKDADKQARKEKREAANKKLEMCFGRVAAYFGLRPALKEGVEQPSFANGELKPIDSLSPAQFNFQDKPIFISLDTEWMEDSGTLTEVGISVLDTDNLQGVVPGDFGHMWLSQIQARHLRMEEYRFHVNTKYQQGCPDYFNHGKSEFIQSADIAEVLNEVFSPSPLVVAGFEQKRTVILVGVNLSNDIDILRRKNCQAFLELDPSLPPPCSPVIHEVIDVSQLYRIYSGDLQPPGLANLLRNLQIIGRDLHNAGNDAYHTLEALVRLMLQAAGEKPQSYDAPAFPLVLEGENTECVQASSEQVQGKADTCENEEDLLL